MRFLLDTHIAVWWLSDPKRLSREQIRIIREAQRRGEQVGLSATSLIEIAVLRIGGGRGGDLNIEDVFTQLEEQPIFRIIPVTIPIALEARALGELRDPADRAIAATARIHHLTLLTSDRRMIESKLVPVVE